MNNVFDLPAFFEREYYESRYIMHTEKGNDLRWFWWNTYRDNALSYAWCEVYYSVLPVDGWKEAMKQADARKKELEKIYK